MQQDDLIHLFRAAAGDKGTPGRRRRLALVVMLTLAALLVSPTLQATTGAESPPTLAELIESSQELAQRHRYADVVTLLEPIRRSRLEPEARYAVAVELGRARFHVGDYRGADLDFREAVRLHPEHIESALYLQATSYLLGHHEQAMAIFSEVVKSGAHDLFLAVTLPGERRFLAEAEVWDILDSAAQPLTLAVGNGTALGVALGDQRTSVVIRLGAGQANNDAPALTTSAGPHNLWALLFDDDGHLAEIVINAENLLRYTPFRLDLDGQLSSYSSSVSFVKVLGEPTSRVTTDEGEDLTWRTAQHSTTLIFGSSKEPAPPQLEAPSSMLKMVHMRLGSAQE